MKKFDLSFYRKIAVGRDREKFRWIKCCWIFVVGTYITKDLLIDTEEPDAYDIDAKCFVDGKFG